MDVRTISIGSLSSSSAAWLRAEGQATLRRIAKQELNEGIKLRGGTAAYSLNVDGRPGRRLDNAERRVIILFDVATTLNLRQLVGAVGSLVYNFVNKITGRLGNDLSVDVWRVRTKKVDRSASTGTASLNKGDVVRVSFNAPYSTFVSRSVARRAVVATALRGRSRRVKLVGDTIRVSISDLKQRSLTVKVARRLAGLAFMRGLKTSPRYLKGNPDKIAIDVKTDPKTSRFIQ